MRTKITQDIFINRSNSVHANFYDYSKTCYINAKSKVIITCPLHGDFLQIPNIHLRGHKCPKCATKNGAGLHIRDINEVSQQLQKIYPNLKIINYNGLSKKSVIEDNLGIQYNVILNQVFRNNYPTLQSALDKNLAFAIKANLVHENRYLYDKINYKHTQTPVIITCENCGDFKQTPNSHLNGNGCPICNRQRGYSKSGWIKFCNSKNTNTVTLYVIKCYNNFEEFLKIGITTRSISDRFSFTRDMPYNFEILYEYRDAPLNIYNKEKYLHKLCKNYKYVPTLSFAGKTECFLKEAITGIDNEFQCTHNTCF